MKTTDPTFKAALDEARRLHAKGALAEAEFAYQRLSAEAPGSVEVIHLRGLLAFQRGLAPAALPLLKRAVDAVPSEYKYRSNYAIALRSEGLLGEALEQLEAAAALRPQSAEVATNLANVYRDLGQFREAWRELARAVALAPDDIEPQSNRLFGMLYDDAASPSAIADAHTAWGARVAAVLSPRTNWNREWKADRPLRVGFVSGDLRDHSVAFFLEPLWRGLQGRGVEIHAYSAGRWEDSVTQALRQFTTAWKSIQGMSDEAAAEEIDRDRIDVLVDLGGHTGTSRIMIFASRPSPVQVSYLGYPHHPGLAAIDYRISDVWADPAVSSVGGDPVWRLSRCAWCYKPPEDAPMVTSFDGLRLNEAPVFGSFNQLGKICPRTVELWTGVLAAVPNATLVVKAKALRDPTARYTLMEKFLPHRIDISRIKVEPWARRRNEHLGAYARIDVALDTFPYHGTTTTCEALWMGVPVVSRIGDTPPARVGASLLHACGLAENAATTDEAFVSRAVALASDRLALRVLRSELRARVNASPLTGATSLGAAFAEALRELWRNACRKAGQE